MFILQKGHQQGVYVPLSALVLVFYHIIARYTINHFFSIFLYLNFECSILMIIRLIKKAFIAIQKTRIAILIRTCTYLTFGLAVTLIRSFRRVIHPGTLCHTPKNISSIDAEH